MKRMLGGVAAAGAVAAAKSENGKERARASRRNRALETELSRGNGRIGLEVMRGWIRG
jgi:hypothetical protein